MNTKLALNALSYSSRKTNLSSFPKKTGLNILRTKGTFEVRKIVTNCSQLRSFESAYGAYVKFFASQIEELGVTGTLEKYIFDSEVNKNGINMLSRLVAGA